MRTFTALAVVIVIVCSASSGTARATRGPQSRNSPIDLVQIQLILPDKLTVGKVFRVLDEVENQGTAYAMPTVTGFYLSTDNVFDERDVLVGGRRVPRLGANQSHSTTTPVTLKTNIPPGVYYFIALADAKHELEERYVDNNTRAVRITVLAADTKTQH